MADISTEIQAFEDAVYGEDVRGAIVDLANKLNDDLEDALEHEFVEVDDTLSISGQGADAAATGAALDMKANKNNPQLSGSMTCGTLCSASNSSAAFGNNTTANGFFSHAEGSLTTASGQSAHSEGQTTTASGQGAHAEGRNTTASGNFSHAEGTGSVASSESSHAEGHGTIAATAYQHVEGNFNISDSNGDYIHIVGNGTSDNARSNAHTLDDGGNGWFAGDIHVGGTYYGHPDCTILSSSTSKIHGSFVTGNATNASGQKAVAHGNTTTASGNYSFSQGSSTIASGNSSHAEGQSTKAVGEYSHAEGLSTEANEMGSHAEGATSKANGIASHAEGMATLASSQGQHVEGKFNIEDANGVYAHIIGNGSSSARANAHTLDWSGNAWFAGDIRIGGSDYSDGNTVLTDADVDATPTQNSDNPISSGGVYTALSAKQDSINTTTKPLGTNSSGKTNMATTEFVQTNKGTWFAKCTTPSETASKAATVYTQQNNASNNNGFSRYVGAVVFVLFQNTIITTNTTLDINNTGSASIILKTGTSLPANLIGQNAIVCVVWDGSNWVMVDTAVASTTKYGWTQLYDGVDSSSNTLAATANAVKTAYDLANRLPPFSAQDAGKVLSINTNGELVWVTP